MSPYQQSIGQSVTLRTVRDERDVEGYAAFHATHFGEHAGIICDYLLHHHPEISYDDFLFVEDESTGEVISTTCLIPWHCRYEDVPLEVAMLEMVATHPQYRRRGYIRAQVNRFHEMVSDRHFDLSIVWGIPYYYRQYGYAYAIDGRYSADSLPASAVPDAHEREESPYKLRQATVDDAPVLVQLYQESMAAVQLHDARDLAYWQFLLRWMQYPVQIVEDQYTGRSVGYVCVARPDLDEQADSKATTVRESAIASQDAGVFVLRQLKANCGGEIQLGWPQTSTLVQIGRSWGSTPPSPGRQYLLRIPDLAGLLSKIRSVLERRVAASAWAGLTVDLCINLFREAFMLQFEQGKLRKVAPLGFVDASVGVVDGGDLCIPPAAFVRLVFGYRNLNELRDAWPDITVKGESRDLVDILFPKMTSYFCMPWEYYGPRTTSSA